jgi:hypothetical protein
MSNKKRVHLQQFDTTNSNLIYIINPERNKNLLVLFHLLKTYIRNPSILFISGFTLPPRGKRRWAMATTIRARIYTRREVSFAKFLFLPS